MDGKQAEVLAPIANRMARETVSAAEAVPSANSAMPDNAKLTVAAARLIAAPIITASTGSQTGEPCNFLFR